MIEKKFIMQKMDEHRVQEFLKERLSRLGYSHSVLQKTPLGMKVIIWTHKPGLIVGRGGENIQEISELLKTEFNLPSPQIDVREVEVPDMDPQIMAERIASQLSRFGVTRFKAIGYRALTTIMDSGALGAEVKISGKVPSKRARYWRFTAGHLPKSGETAKVDVLKGFRSAKLKPGIVGVTVKVLPPNVRRPDEIRYKKEEAAPGGDKVGDTEA
jgi:small subunit ribosomal protein S3